MVEGKGYLKKNGKLSTFGHKTLSYHEKMKTPFQMTYTIRMVRLRQFIEPGLGVSTYLDFGARLFSTQWPPYGAHILQGLLTNCTRQKHTQKKNYLLLSFDLARRNWMRKIL